MPRLDKSVPSTADPLRWLSRDWLLVGNIGLLSGLLLAGLFWLVLLPLVHMWLGVIGFLPLVAGMTLIWFPGALSAAAVGKPGAALTVQIPQAIVLLLLTPLDGEVLLACTFFALVAEPVIALCTRYRQLTPIRLGWCGLFVGVGMVILVAWLYPFIVVSLPLAAMIGGSAIGLTSLLGISAGWIARRWLKA
ncbi:MAG: hypothetical protein KatS3mg054_0963 [Chloroflexus sp.]|nr:MAG: hypothetical protein KatS3mg054_0963 [Chloroflexus sp.]